MAEGAGMGECSVPLSVEDLSEERVAEAVKVKDSANEFFKSKLRNFQLSAVRTSPIIVDGMS